MSSHASRVLVNESNYSTTSSQNGNSGSLKAGRARRALPPSDPLYDPRLNLADSSSVLRRASRVTGSTGLHENVRPLKSNIIRSAPQRVELEPVLLGKQEIYAQESVALPAQRNENSKVLIKETRKPIEQVQQAGNPVFKSNTVSASPARKVIPQPEPEIIKDNREDETFSYGSQDIDLATGSREYQILQTQLLQNRIINQKFDEYYSLELKSLSSMIDSQNDELFSLENDIDAGIIELQNTQQHYHECKFAQEFGSKLQQLESMLQNEDFDRKQLQLLHEIDSNRSIIPLNSVESDDYQRLQIYLESEFKSVDNIQMIMNENLPIDISLREEYLVQVQNRISKLVLNTHSISTATELQSQLVFNALLETLSSS